MLALTQEQAFKVVAQLRADGQALLAKVTQARDDAGGSFVQYGLSIFGQDSGPQLNAQVGAVRSILGSVDGLARQADNGLDEQRSDAWVDAAKEAARSLSAISGYSGEATLDWVIQQTARATGETVKQGINTAASAALGFAWSAIPWWALVGAAAFVAWRLGLLRRAK